MAGSFCTSELAVDSEKPSDTNHQWLRTKVMSSITFPGFCVKSSYFGEGETIASAPGKAVDTLDIPELGEEATRVFPRDEGPRGLRDEPLSGRWSGEAPYTAHKILIEYTEES